MSSQGQADGGERLDAASARTVVAVADVTFEALRDAVAEPIHA